jgi:hypothetical protein
LAAITSERSIHYHYCLVYVCNQDLLANHLFGRVRSPQRKSRATFSDSSADAHFHDQFEADDARAKFAVLLVVVVVEVVAAVDAVVKTWWHLSHTRTGCVKPSFSSGNFLPEHVPQNRPPQLRQWCYTITTTRTTSTSSTSSSSPSSSSTTTPCCSTRIPFYLQR